MSARSCYNITTGEGSIIVNVSLVKNSDLPEAVNLLYESFTSGYTMGELITLFEPGKKTAPVFIPWGYTGIGTVSSVNINSILLKKQRAC